MKLLSPEELEAALREIGARRYHRLHPFHALLHGGKCTKGQVQAWALNRYYYQAMIPIKDASLIARCEDSAVRREWRSRLVDHDGEREGDGGIARWLKLTDGLGLDRDYVTSLARIVARHALCGRCLCAFRARKDAARSDRVVADRNVFAGDHQRAHGGMLANYAFVTRETLSYFDKRPPQAERDADFALDYVKRNARTPEQQQACWRRSNSNAACCGRCWTRYITPMWRPKHIPPGAFVPEDHDGPVGNASFRRCSPAAPARRAADAQRSAGRLGSARARTRVQGGRDYRGDIEALHRRSHAGCRSSTISPKTFAAPRERIHADVVKLLGGLAEKKLLELG